MTQYFPPLLAALIAPMVPRELTPKRYVRRGLALSFRCSSGLYT